MKTLSLDVFVLVLDAMSTLISPALFAIPSNAEPRCKFGYMNT